MSAKTIRFDRSKCTACCACAMACMDEKNQLHDVQADDLRIMEQFFFVEFFL